MEKNRCPPKQPPCCDGGTNPHEDITVMLSGRKHRQDHDAEMKTHAVEELSTNEGINSTASKHVSTRSSSSKTIIVDEENHRQEDEERGDTPLSGSDMDAPRFRQEPSSSSSSPSSHSSHSSFGSDSPLSGCSDGATSSLENCQSEEDEMSHHGQSGQGRKEKGEGQAQAPVSLSTGDDPALSTAAQGTNERARPFSRYLSPAPTRDKMKTMGIIRETELMESLVDYISEHRGALAAPQAPEDDFFAIPSWSHSPRNAHANAHVVSDILAKKGRKLHGGCYKDLSMENHGTFSTASSSTRTGSRRASTTNPSGGIKSHDSIVSLGELTGRLKCSGMYEEYQRWNEGYKRWKRAQRNNVTFPPQDEMTSNVDIEAKKQKSNASAEDFELVFPSFEKFIFKRTFAYWVGAFFLNGATVFSFSSLFLLIQDKTDLNFPKELTSVPSIFGALWFLCGSWLGCLQAYNIEVGIDEPFRYITAPWDLRRSFPTTFISWSMMGWQLYFYGSLFYLLSMISICIDDISPTNRCIWTYTPGVMGGSCFVIGGLCEIGENRKEPFKFVWWSCVINFLSGACFFFGALAPAFVVPGTWTSFFTNVTQFLGSLGFCCTGVMAFVMWKNDKFGLSLGRKINQVISPPSKPLSRNTIIVNSVYTVASGIATFNFCLSMQGDLWLQRMSESLESLIIFLLVHLLLTLTSVTPKLPKMQPYRGLMLCVRFISVIVFFSVIITFCWSLVEIMKKQQSDDVINNVVHFRPQVSLFLSSYTRAHVDHHFPILSHHLSISSSAIGTLRAA